MNTQISDTAEGEQGVNRGEQGVNMAPRRVADAASRSFFLAVSNASTLGPYRGFSTPTVMTTLTLPVVLECYGTHTCIISAATRRPSYQAGFCFVFCESCSGQSVTKSRSQSSYSQQSFAAIIRKPSAGPWAKLRGAAKAGRCGEKWTLSAFPRCRGVQSRVNIAYVGSWRQNPV